MITIEDMETTIQCELLRRGVEVKTMIPILSVGAEEGGRIVAHVGDATAIEDTADIEGLEYAFRTGDTIVLMPYEREFLEGVIAREYEEPEFPEELAAS